MEREAYKAEIKKALENCADIELLDFIYRMLTQTAQTE